MIFILMMNKMVEDIIILIFERTAPFEKIAAGKIQRVILYNNIRKDKHVQYKIKSEYKKSKNTKIEYTNKSA